MKLTKKTAMRLFGIKQRTWELVAHQGKQATIAEYADAVENAKGKKTLEAKLFWEWLALCNEEPDITVAHKAFLGLLNKAPQLTALKQELFDTWCRKNLDRYITTTAIDLERLVELSDRAPYGCDAWQAIWENLATRIPTYPRRQRQLKKKTQTAGTR